MNTKISGYYENTKDVYCSNTVSFHDYENCVNNFKINENIWKIEIPKINLEANISEGTTKEILDEYVGHFEETQRENGNIGLAAHNRGYRVNYFEKIKELEIGDEIFYTYKGKRRLFVIELKTIIKDTQWENLQNTKDNQITLITCVENMPEYRRCIQAVEV